MHGSKMLHRHAKRPVVLRRVLRRVPLLCALGLPLVCLIGGMGCESANDPGPTSRPGDRGPQGPDELQDR